MRRSIFSKIHLHVKVVDILKTCSSDKGESPIYGKYKIVSHSVGRKNVFFIYCKCLTPCNTLQVPRYLLFCEGGIFSAHALTLVGTKLIPSIGITL